MKSIIECILEANKGYYQFFETFTFSITTALLTLIGLVAIFISINTQHSIQKSREIHWDLMGYLYEEQDENFFKSIRGRIKRNIKLYKQATNSNNITNIIVCVSILAILSVLYIWWNYFYYVKGLNVDEVQISHAKIYLIIITNVFILFIIILFIMTKPKLIGNLEKLEKINDGNYPTELSTISLAALSMEVCVIVDYALLQIIIRFPFEYKNIKITPDIILYIPNSKPYPLHKYISRYTIDGDMRLIDDIDMYKELNYGYDVKFNETGEITDCIYKNEQCKLPELHAGVGTEIYSTFYIQSKEGCLQVNFPNVVINDVYGTFEYIRPTSVIVPHENAIPRNL